MVYKDSDSVSLVSDLVLESSDLCGPKHESKWYVLVTHMYSLVKNSFGPNLIMLINVAIL